MKYILFLSLMLITAVSAQPQYVPQVIWDRSGETADSWYGREILPLGDQNGDGFADWAVNTGFDAGKALEFFHGAESLPMEPYHTFHLDTVLYQGFGSRGTGDFNGDGYVDWVLTLTRHFPPPLVDHGIFFGGPTISDTPDVVFMESWQVATYPIGDFNGDQFDDLYFYDFDTNIAWICYGGEEIDNVPDWMLNVSPPGINQSIPRAVGDFTGDGASDFMCFNPNNGNIAVFLGGVQPDTIPDYNWTDMMQPKAGIKSLNGDIADEFLLGLGLHFGGSELSPNPDTFLNSIAGGYAASAGDFNGDSYNDLILYTWSTLDNPFGALTLHLGHPWIFPDPAFTIEGDTPPLNLRGIYTAVGLGDVNGDSTDDIAIGAWDETFWRRGRCVVLSGDDTLIADTEDRPELPQALEVSVYPNPFNSESTIRLLTPALPGQVTLSIFNLLGQEILSEQLPPFAGEYVYRLNARTLTTGLYLLHVSSNNLSTTTKLMVLR